MEKAGARIGLLGLACPSTPVPDGFTVRDPVEAAREGIEALRRDGAQAIIVLSALGRQDVDRVAQEVEGIDLLLGDRNLSIPRFLEPRGKTLVLEAGQKGKQVNVLTLHFTELGKHPVVVRETGEKFVQELQQLDQRLQRYASMVNRPPQPGTRGADPERFKGIIERQLQERAALVEKIKSTTTVNVEAPFVTFEAVPLNKARQADGEVQGWVD
ncbi:MAG: hypothetical protein FJ098_13470, partial [Deltaproteobacteria bacterium]|nr:hypothetical protein [Deltaproteobacteria bacterium]